MKPRTAVLLAIPPLIVGGLWLRSEFTTDLLMRRAPVIVNGSPVDLSRGLVSTRGCLLLRRIAINPGHTARPVWDWTVTPVPQLPDPRTPANRLGFGAGGGSISSPAGIKMTINDSWFPYWFAEIIVMIPLLVAIPYVRWSSTSEPLE